MSIVKKIVATTVIAPVAGFCLLFAYNLAAVIAHPTSSSPVASTATHRSFDVRDIFSPEERRTLEANVKHAMERDRLQDEAKEERAKLNFVVAQTNLCRVLEQQRMSTRAEECWSRLRSLGVNP